MNQISEIAIYYIIIVNVFTLILFGVDKWKAKRGKWRIAEATLLGFSILGGSMGALCAMRLFHHKTLHKKFHIGVPTILILQIAITIYLKLRYN